MAESANTPALEADDLVLSWDGVHAVVSHVSMSVAPGEVVCLVGRSGCGKTTILHALSGLTVPDAGRVLLHGTDITGHPGKVSYMLQKDLLLPHKTIEDNVSLPLLYAGLSKSDQRKRAMKQLERVGLEDKWMQHPAQLSGGQQQRVSIARALAGDPELILADEPTGALDTKTSRQVMGFLQDINQDGTTVVMITHDNALALEAKRVIRISDGRVVFDGKTEDYAKFI